MILWNENMGGSKYLLLKLCMLFFAISLVGCGNGPKKSVSSKKEQTNNSSGVLVLLNWDDYIGSNTLKMFTEETGIKVKFVPYDSEDSMLGSVQSDPSAYDLVVACDDTVRELAVARLLEPLDYSKIPNFRFIDNNFLYQRWDKKQQFTVPYMSGTTGVVVNKKRIPDYEPSWKLLWDFKYKGKLAMLAEPFEAIGAAKKMLGFSLNETDSGKLLLVKKSMLRQKKMLRGYYVESEILELLKQGKIWAGQVYSGEGMLLADSDKRFEFFIPEEGAARWIDMFFIPRGAQHVEEAHKFLNFILRPEINAAIASELWYATPNKAAEKLVDPEVLRTPAVYPPRSIKERCEFFRDIGLTTRVYNRLWANVLAK